MFIPGRYSKVRLYSSSSKSQCKTKSEAFNPLKGLFLRSFRTTID
jgi:hypothetical protein